MIIPSLRRKRTTENTDPPPKERRQKRIVRDVNRGKWKNKTEFILSCLGYAIGIGNVWRFPYLCYRSGGAAFLVPYLLMVAVVGIPLYYMEVLIGQFSGTGCTAMFRMAPILKGTGISMVIVNMYCVCYYSVLLSYSIRMISYCFRDPVPWVSCNHPWNTENCSDVQDLAGKNETEYLKTSSDEFFHKEVLRLSKSIADLGGIVWWQLLSLFITWIIIYLCIVRGIKSVGKVVYFTAPFPYLLLAILFVRGVTLKGAGSGIIFYMLPEWKKLLDLKVWTDAAVQMFFGLGPGWGGIVNMASFNDFHNDARFDSIFIPLINVATSIFAGFVVFSVLGFLSAQSGIPVANVATSGPALAFVTYPEAIAMMPLPQLWGIMFFVMLFILGIDSVFVQLEAVITSLSDEIQVLRSHKKKLTFFACLIFFLAAVIMTTNGGFYILQLLDWYSSAISVICICTVEVFMVSFIYGIKNFMTDVEFMTGKRPSLFWKISWQIISPIVLVSLFVTAIIFIRTITYDGVPYPTWAIIIGWCTCASSIMFIPLYIIFIMCIKRKTMLESLKKRLKPLDWTPAEPEDRFAYESFRKMRRSTHDFMSDTSIEGDDRK